MFPILYCIDKLHVSRVQQWRSFGKLSNSLPLPALLIGPYSWCNTTVEILPEGRSLYPRTPCLRTRNHVQIKKEDHTRIADTEGAILIVDLLSGMQPYDATVQVILYTKCSQHFLGG